MLMTVLVRDFADLHCCCWQNATHYYCNDFLLASVQQQPNVIDLHWHSSRAHCVMNFKQQAQMYGPPSLLLKLA